MRIKSMMVAAAYAVAGALLADPVLSDSDVYTTGDVSGFGASAGWSSSAAPDSSHDYWVVNDKWLRDGTYTSPTFLGRTLNVGAPASKGFSKKTGYLAVQTATKTATIPNLVWYCGGIWGNSQNMTWTYKGHAKVVQADADATHSLCVSTANQKMVVDFTLTSETSVGSQPVVGIGADHTGWMGRNNINPMANMDAGNCTYTLTGDFSGYKGTFSLTGPYSPVIYARSGLLGDPGEANASAVSLQDNAAIAFSADFEQDAGRGFEIAGARAYLMTWETLANSYTVKYPICGTGTLCKRGPGTVTLAGDYSASGGLEVQAGTLVLDALGTFPSGLGVVVSNGATLVQHKQIPNISVQVEEGGTWIRDIQYVVPYSDADGTSTPLDFTDAVPTLPLSLKLSEPVAIASFAGNGFTAKRIDVAKLPADATATADDFVDGSDKTCGLPRTGFEIESRAGYKAVVLVARPVVWSVATLSDQTNGLNGNSGTWANGAVAQPEFDYFVTNTVMQTGRQYNSTSPAFNGGSLTIVGGGLYMTSPNVDVGDLTFYGNVIVRYNAGEVNPFSGITCGSVCVADGAYIELKTLKMGNGRIGTGRIATAVSGNGSIEASLNSKIDGGAPVYLTGDNSAFSGKLKVTNPGTITSVADATTLHLGEATSFGGAMAEATADGVTLEKYSLLQPEKTMTLDATNRGITIMSGGFNVSNELALTVAVPLTIAGPAFKLGAGELALGGALTLESGGFTVMEGAVRPLADAAVAGDFTFADGTTIVLDPAAGLTDGFTGAFAIAAGGHVVLALDETHLGGATDAARVPICTVPASGADLTDSFILNGVRGYKSRIAKTDVVVAGVPCVRYSAHFVPGLVITFR